MILHRRVTRTMHGYYWLTPLVSAAVWFTTLLILLLTWIGLGRPKYPPMVGSVAFISDVGAHFLKPLFVIGTILTSLTFVATLASLLYLQAPQKQDQEDASGPPGSSQNIIVDVQGGVPTRLPAHGRTSERILAIMALVAALIGGAGLILLSGFDTWRYHTLHRIFLAVFMFGVALSALFTMIQFALLARSHRNRQPDDYKLTRKSAISKGVAVLVLISLSIVFTILLSRMRAGDTHSYDIAAVLEWVIGFCFIGYLLTFVYDLRHARSRESMI